jgi:poly(3-hydroxybutyrate) depolymerase
MKFAIVVLAALVAPATVSAAEKITRETLGSGGRTRTYYLYVPETVREGAPAPLIVFLHGSGRNGSLLVDKWKDVARKEGLILAGPDSIDSRQWSMAEDGPDFIHDVVDIVSAQHPVDPRRMYLFGHSAGAIHALLFALLESQYFAAAAVHAGALPTETYVYADSAPRKIPIAIWVGTNDAFFPLAAVRATRDALAQRAIPVELTEMKGHTHDYYSRSSEINKAAWAFLKPHALAREPVFTKYQIGKTPVPTPN